MVDSTIVGNCDGFSIETTEADISRYQSRSTLNFIIQVDPYTDLGVAFANVLEVPIQYPESIPSKMVKKIP